MEEYLRALGATELVSREEASRPPGALESVRWSGAVDTVGGPILARLIAETGYGGTIAISGMAASMEYLGSVVPFILRGLSMVGIESVACPLEGRKTPQLKPQMENIVLAQAPRDGTFVDNWLEHRTGLIDTSDPLIDPQWFPGTVIRSAKPRQRYGHLTAKPVELLRHLIRIFSAPGVETLILDPFAGSGSTGVAARTEGRGFLGFEIDPAMAETADRRVVDCLESEPT